MILDTLSTGRRPSNSRRFVFARRGGENLYRNGLKCKESEEIGTERDIRSVERGSGIAVMAIHGGRIEPGTSELAEAIAGDEYDFYAYEGRKPTGNKILHVTSTDFDEPVGLQIAGNSETVLTIHGSQGKEEIIFIGGLFKEMRERIRERLDESGFRTAESKKFPGASPLNPCNRCRSGRGVQLELTRGLRSAMFQDKSLKDCTKPTGKFLLFAELIRSVLSEYPGGRLSPVSSHQVPE